MDNLSKLWSPDKPANVIQKPIDIAPPPAAAPTKESDAVQTATEEERRKRAASQQGLDALTQLTGGLGDADFSSVKRVTLG